MTQLITIDKDEEIRQYHLKRLYELSKPGPGKLDFKVDGSVWRDGRLLTERMTEDQDAWFIRRMHGPAWTWKRWYQ